MIHICSVDGLTVTVSGDNRTEVVERAIVAAQRAYKHNGNRDSVTILGSKESQKDLWGEPAF